MLGLIDAPDQSGLTGTWFTARFYPERVKIHTKVIAQADKGFSDWDANRSFSEHNVTH